MSKYSSIDKIMNILSLSNEEEIKNLMIDIQLIL
jgi:hypothetical protein